MDFKLLMGILTLTCCEHPSSRGNICETSHNYLERVASSREFDGLDIQYMAISERQHGKRLKHRIKESSYSPIIRGLEMGMADFVKPRSYEECEGKGGRHEDEYCGIGRIMGRILDNKQLLLALVRLNHIFSLEGLRGLTTSYKVYVGEERVGRPCTEAIDAGVYKITIKHHRSRQCSNWPSR